MGEEEEEERQWKFRIFPDGGMGKLFLEGGGIIRPRPKVVVKKRGDDSAYNQPRFPPKVCLFI